MAPEMTSVQTDSVETRRKTTRNRDFGKGKKRDIKRNIPSDLIPIEEETWLLQPIAVTMMRHDYSLIQTDTYPRHDCRVYAVEVA